MTYILNPTPSFIVEKNKEEVQMTEETKETNVTTQKDHDFGSIPKLVGFILTVTSSQLITVAQLGIVAYPVEIISNDLNFATTIESAWFMAAYSLTAGVFVLVSGQLGDIIGHKIIFTFGWLWMAIWTLISSFATNTIFFCVCRALAGLGSAFLAPNGMALLGRAFIPGSTKKNISFALLGAKAPAGYIFGGVFGALLAQKSSWKWAMRLLSFLSFAFAAFSIIFIPSAIGNRDEKAIKIRSFDWLGSITGTSGLILFSFTWNQAGIVGWDVPFIYALLIVSIILLASFAYIETNVKHPLLPPILWSKPGFLPIIIAMCLGWMSFGIWLYFTTIFLLDFRQRTPLEAVAEMVPLVPVGFIATACVGIFINRIPAQFIFGVAMLSFFIGNLLMSLTPNHQTYWAMVFPATLLVPFGPDLSFASAAIMISDVVGSNLQGVSASFVNSVVLYSVSLGLGIAGVVERYIIIKTNDSLYAAHSVHYLGVGMAILGFIIVVIFVRDQRDLKDYEKRETDVETASD